MGHEESQSSDSRQALAREDSSHNVGCYDETRRGNRNGQRSDERVLRIVKDQIGQECAVVLVLSRKSTIWRGAIVKTLLRKRQMQYIDVEEMRVVTNDKDSAEQIKSDLTLPVRERLLNRKVENVVMNRPEVRKLGKEQHLKSMVLDGVKKWEMWSQEGKKEEW